MNSSVELVSPTSFYMPTISASSRNHPNRKLPEPMESWKRLTRFLFPVQSGNWLTILRIGLGLQVLLYALSLRRDWIYLLAGTGEGLNGRALSEGLLSTESCLVLRLC